MYSPSLLLLVPVLVAKTYLPRPWDFYCIVEKKWKLRCFLQSIFCWSDTKSGILMDINKVDVQTKDITDGNIIHTKIFECCLKHLPHDILGETK